MKGNRHEHAYSFRLEDKGPINSIKFNPDLSILAIKRNSNSVEFLNFAPIPQTPLSPRAATSTITTILQPDESEYSQLSKFKQNRLYDFNWLSDREILFVTNGSIEHYVVSPEKRSLRLLKHYESKNTNWQLFSREMGLLLISCGSPSGNSLVPFAFSKTPLQTLTKYPKFDVDLPHVAIHRSNSTTSASSATSSNRQSYDLAEKDCLLSSIYGKSYLLIIRQVSRVPGKRSVLVEVLSRENVFI